MGAAGDSEGDGVAVALVDGEDPGDSDDVADALGLVEPEAASLGAAHVAPLLGLATAPWVGDGVKAAGEATGCSEGSATLEAVTDDPAPLALALGDAPADVGIAERSAADGLLPGLEDGDAEPVCNGDCVPETDVDGLTVVVVVDWPSPGLEDGDADPVCDGDAVPETDDDGVTVTAVVGSPLPGLKDGDAEPVCDGDDVPGTDVEGVTEVIAPARPRPALTRDSAVCCNSGTSVGAAGDKFAAQNMRAHPRNVDSRGI
jgi:hypothetical protein